MFVKVVEGSGGTFAIYSNVTQCRFTNSNGKHVAHLLDTANAVTDIELSGGVVYVLNDQGVTVERYVPSSK